jgi:hypothetical protein
MEKELTTVEWLVEKLNKYELANYSVKLKIIEQAKKMEEYDKISAKIQGLYLASTDAMGISYRIMELEEKLKSLTLNK